MKHLIILAVLPAIALLGAVGVAHPAFALQHFFNCVTDAANKAGGDHNLSLQQVVDCFKKEFPNNPGTTHFDKNLDLAPGVTIEHGNIHINEGASASASASAG